MPWSGVLIINHRDLTCINTRPPSPLSVNKVIKITNVIKAEKSSHCKYQTSTSEESGLITHVWGCRWWTFLLLLTWMHQGQASSCPEISTLPHTPIWPSTLWPLLLKSLEFENQRCFHDFWGSYWQGIHTPSLSKYCLFFLFFFNTVFSYYTFIIIITIDLYLYSSSN